jgi:CDP-diglyceride synthetase
MLKYRLIFGLVFGALFIAVILLDAYNSNAWPSRPYSAPPGTFVAMGCLILIPLALREMRTLLASENVTISMRITVVATLLCMLWPWIEQVSEHLVTEHTRIEERARQMGATYPATAPTTESKALYAIETSPWWFLAQWTRSVKPHYLVPTILALSLVAAVVMHSRNQRVEGAMANAGGTLLAIVYLGVLPGFFLPICMTHSAWMLMGTVAIVKAADVGAYTTGRLIGRHKLIPWLSPGKTIEGFIGGVIFSALVAAYVASFFNNFTWKQGIFAGMLLGAVGQLGDLFESLLKRDAGVKDSGKLPGFGGILDLLDSPLLAAPVAYWLLKLVARTY